MRRWNWLLSKASAYHLRILCGMSDVRMNQQVIFYIIFLLSKTSTWLVYGYSELFENVVYKHTHEVFKPNTETCQTLTKNIFFIRFFFLSIPCHRLHYLIKNWRSSEVAGGTFLPNYVIFRILMLPSLSYKHVAAVVFSSIISSSF